MLKLQNKKFLYLLAGNEPSSFVRALVYKEEFKKKGFCVNYFSLNSSILSQLINHTQYYPIRLIFRILNKLYFLYKQYALLNRISEYDVIVAVKFIDSNLLKQIKSKTNALLIYDFDDAVWLNMFYGENEFSKKISIVDCTTSDNNYLKERASIYNKNSFIVNGPCQIEKFSSFKNEAANKPLKSDETIILGWVGSPYTLFYLYKIYDALELIGEIYSNVILKLVGTGSERLLIPPFEKIKVVSIPTYDQSEMIKQVCSFDIGLYPLFLNELSLGRGALKATIYMSGGVPVVCSPIGENKKLIQDGVSGFLASNTDEWVAKLSVLIENPELRSRIGTNGFNLAYTNYSIESCANQLLKIIETQLYNKSH